MNENTKAPNFEAAKTAFKSRRSIRADFMRHVTKTDEGDWLFEPTGPTGYGRYMVGPYRMQAHIVSKIIHDGMPNEGDLCLHLCVGVRNCVNPAHLYWGKHQDNMDDLIRQKRGRNRKGEESSNSQLSLIEVIAIWVEYSLLKSNPVAIAQRIRRPTTVVRAVCKQITWAHVTSFVENIGYPAPVLRKGVNAPSGEDSPTSNLTFADVRKMRIDYGRGLTIYAIAVKAGRNVGNVAALVKRETWKELDETILLSGKAHVSQNRLISFQDVVDAVEKKIRTGKSIAWAAKKYQLPEPWLQEMIASGTPPQKSKILKYWLRSASELNELEIVTIWRLANQAQWTEEMLTERFALAKGVAKAVSENGIRPQLVRRLDLRPGDGGVVTGRAGAENAAAKLTEKQVQSIRRRLCNGERDAALAREFKMSPAGIAMLRRGETYDTIPWPPDLDRSVLDRSRILGDEIVCEIYTLSNQKDADMEAIAQQFNTERIVVQKIRRAVTYKKATKHLREGTK